MRRRLPLQVAAVMLAASASPARAAQPLPQPQSRPQAPPPPLRMVAPLNHAMPFGEFKDGVMVGGIVKDLSDAVGQRIGRRVTYVSTPARRVAAAIRQGEADGVCYVAKTWIDGDFHWSPPVFDHVGVLAAKPAAPSLARLDQLAGQRVGTVVAYRYPEVERTLGSKFLRDDAPNMDSALRKLLAGRTVYILTEQLTLAYAMRQQPHNALRAVLETARYSTHCAFRDSSQLPLAELDQAVQGLRRDGSIAAILARYR